MYFKSKVENILHVLMIHVALAESHQYFKQKVNHSCNEPEKSSTSCAA
jgi:hypothetical protein